MKIDNISLNNGDYTSDTFCQSPASKHFRNEIFKFWDNWISDNPLPFDEKDWVQLQLYIDWWIEDEEANEINWFKKRTAA